ncbi:MAG: GntR family transcriptional regulator [Paracoccus aminovorans]|nr:GntR family transcriptional regulator [Paracoccus aminovorans]
MSQDSSNQQGQTQTARAVMTLRDLVVRGSLDPGQRYTETQLAELLAMSRTPIRAAVQRLTDEGLLTPMPGGGYGVRQFSPVEISEAIELRGVLEGLCASLLAERGLAAELLDQLSALSDSIAAVLAVDDFGPAGLAEYERLNARLHHQLVIATDSTLLIQEVARANNRPFASASALVGLHRSHAEARLHLLIGQDQHRIVIEAIRNRQAGRAEAVMREHARLSQQNLMRRFDGGTGLQALRGASLIHHPDPAGA